MLEVDSTFAFDDALGAGRGLAVRGLDAVAPRVAAAFESVRARRAAGGLAWMDLPRRTDLAEQVAGWRPSCPPFDDVLLFGIGGSALAALVFGALVPRGPAGPRLHLVE